MAQHSKLMYIYLQHLYLNLAQLRIGSSLIPRPLHNIEKLGVAWTEDQETTNVKDYTPISQS